MKYWPYPFLIGLLTAMAVAMGLRRSGLGSQRRAVVVFSTVVGVIVVLALSENPALMDEYVSRIALAGLGIVIAVLALAKRSIERD